MSLEWYLSDSITLLNDQNYSFTSQAQITRWINEAREDCAERTGCIRRLITGQSAFGASAQPGYAIPGAMQPGSLPNSYSMNNPGSSGDFNTPDFSSDFNIAQTTPYVAGAASNNMMTIPGVERYPYQGFFLPACQAQYAGIDQILDTIACSVNWGGATRPTLDWMPWDDLQAYCRAYAVLNTSYPSVWSVYNDGPFGEIWMFPVPSQASEIELDVACSPSPLNSNSDFDAIPHGFRKAIKFKAASLAFMSSQRYASAQMMEDQFADNIGVSRVSVDGGKSKSYYWRSP